VKAHETLRTGRAHPHPEPLSGATYSAVELALLSDTVLVLDQRLLPRTERYERICTVEGVADAIRSMMVRGAPAIGITAAYGMVLAANDARKTADAEGFLAALRAAGATLRATRPTAVNLAWAVERMEAAAREVASEAPQVRFARLAAVARAIHTEDVAACRAMGRLGAELVPDGATILTHCNAGALATGGYGTALGVIRAAHEQGKRVRVLASETRPYWQGMRLTAWELHRDGIPVEIVPDVAVAHLMKSRAIDLAVVGADRIARNGDVANKIGTYGVACLAHLHEVPLYVAAPWSTVDLATPDGDAIPIEQRGEREVTHVRVRDEDVHVGPDGVGARHPAFDVTPAKYVRAIVTERGVASPPSEATLRGMAPG
jgi:methylthioribose-1-phosphate isomerase